VDDPPGLLLHLDPAERVAELAAGRDHLVRLQRAGPPGQIGAKDLALRNGLRAARARGRRLAPDRGRARRRRGGGPEEEAARDRGTLGVLGHGRMVERRGGCDNEKVRASSPPSAGLVRYQNAPTSPAPTGEGPGCAEPAWSAGRTRGAKLHVKA